MLCKRLKIIFFEPEYYRDIYVWLPDVMYGTFYDPIRLSCPTCRRNDKVEVHGFSDHYGRRVIDMHTHYYIISRRYICQHCKSANNKDTQYTFTASNEVSVSLLPYSLGNEFPAILTHKGALDKKVLHEMRALFVSGLKPETSCAFQ